MRESAKTVRSSSLPRCQAPGLRARRSRRARSMQDPFHAVKEEVEHSVTVVIDLHKRWHELSASSKKGDEWEWTACASASEE